MSQLERLQVAAQCWAAPAGALALLDASIAALVTFMGVCVWIVVSALESDRIERPLRDSTAMG